MTTPQRADSDRHRTNPGRRLLDSESTAPGYMGCDVEGVRAVRNLIHFMISSGRTPAGSGSKF